MAAWGERIKAWVAEWIASGIDPCAPKYEPDEWNTDKVQGPNNCYNYACNIKTSDGFKAEPGYRATGGKANGGGIIQDITGSNVTEAIKKDGLRP